MTTTGVAPSGEISYADSCFRCLNNPVTKRITAVACGAIASFAVVMAAPEIGSSLAVMALSALVGTLAGAEIYVIYSVALDILNGGYREHPWLSTASMIVIVAAGIFTFATAEAMPTNMQAAMMFLDTLDCLLYGAAVYRVGEAFLRMP